MIVTFFFYDKNYGLNKHLAFSRDIKHCNVVTYDGSDFVLTYFNHKGIINKVIKQDQMSDIINKKISLDKHVSAIVSVWVETRKKRMWSPLILRTCNEISRLVSGVAMGPTFNAKHLYNKLNKLDKKRNFIIDYSWRRT